MDLPNPQRYCLFSQDLHKWTGKQTGLHCIPDLLLSAGRWLPSPHCSFKEAERQVAPLTLHLMLRREGGKEVGREDWGGRKGGKGGGNVKGTSFFFTCDKSCSHMGGTRPCDLTKRLNRECQWSIHQQTRSAWRRWRRGKIKMKRTSVCRTVEELIQAVATECGAFLLWCVWVSTSAALLFYSVRCKRHKNIISSCY